MTEEIVAILRRAAEDPSSRQNLSKEEFYDLKFSRHLRCLGAYVSIARNGHKKLDAEFIIEFTVEGEFYLYAGMQSEDQFLIFALDEGDTIAPILDRQEFMEWARKQDFCW